MLIKLFDRLHNMRTLDAMASDRRSRIARETLAIYAPIAHRLGLDKIFREFQDLSFRHAHPWRFSAINRAMQRARGNRRDMISRTQHEVARALGSLPFAADTSGREKTAYSIYTKMREQRRSFASMTDIFAFRIVVKTHDECYRVLGVLHGLYKPLPGQFRDYIAIPKSNGYQSLHTALIQPNGIAAEFQVRTVQMHEVAESGVAAHWLYKSSGFDAQDARRAQRLEVSWLRSLLERRDDVGDHNEFLEYVRLDMLGDSVYVFTPKSKVLTLPRGSTTVDFAYAIHTEVGDRCVAAKVNGEPVPLRTALKSGDTVEIIGASGGSPNPAWLSFVRTGRARTRIRRCLRDIQVAEAQATGEKILAQALRAEGLRMPPDVRADSPLYERLIDWSANSSLDNLFADIGKGRKNGSVVAKRFARIVADWDDRDVANRFVAMPAGTTDLVPVMATVSLDGGQGLSMNRAGCCWPIPGDAIVSYLGRGEGATVHSVDCLFSGFMRHREPDRWVSASWGDSSDELFETAVRLQVRKGPGLLAQVAQRVGEAVADIRQIQMSDPLEGQVAELTLRIGVRDRNHLAEVMRKLRGAPAILRIARVKAY
jgi:guanosine-3',5'-bis(diphosphate) 3'-pyrophosphohydrolase